MAGNENSGGIRIGSGRKKKPLAEKLLAGEKIKPKLTADIVDVEGVDMPKPQEYLSALQKDGKVLNADKIYMETWEWLNNRGCANLVNPIMIENYAVSVARAVQCEEAISTYGFLSKHPTTGAPITSPFVAIAQGYLKQSQTTWNIIYQIVKENCGNAFNGQSPTEDIMEQLLSSRGL